MPEKIVGMYVHQHWAYNHPYAARTWTLDDWKGYLDGLHRLGFNTVMIWPVLETMPDPLTESDKANLDRIAKVTELAHADFHMRVYIALCPNVMAKNDAAAKYTFEKRPFFHCDRRINPGDPDAMKAMLDWREQLFRPLAKVDGVSIIDSDPGGYPGSTNREFVDLLVAHRKMLDRVRPGIELLYWIHAGWQAYCDYYRTGEFWMGSQAEIEDTLRLLAKANPEPWGLLSGRGPHVGDALGLANRVISFSYGAIEGEPTFPMTNFGGEAAYKAGSDMGARGAMGNSQTHCLQLPNTFAFSRGAIGRPVAEADYVQFANDLIKGQGETIVAGWKALNESNPKKTIEAARALDSLNTQPLDPGPLQGLLFGDAHRFVQDIAMQLRVKATLEEFHETALATPLNKKKTVQALDDFLTAIEVWQKQHGYQNVWGWENLEEGLRALGSKSVNAVLDSRNYRGAGATPFEQIQNGFARGEDYVVRLIAAMKKAAAELRENAK